MGSALFDIRKKSSWLSWYYNNHPGSSKSPLLYIIRRFADKTAMERWDNSEESLRLLKEATDYSTRYYDTFTGLETWFTLPDLKTLTQSPSP
ncbi:MAG TPA: hypothetical protein VFI70_10275 [Nitrososphaeraceae archaeon]|nr:hypothetical protein [Nitrososphaeraceae archaeon]